MRQRGKLVGQRAPKREPVTVYNVVVGEEQYPDNLLETYHLLARQHPPHPLLANYSVEGHCVSVGN